VKKVSNLELKKFINRVNKTDLLFDFHKATVTSWISIIVITAQITTAARVAFGMYFKVDVSKPRHKSTTIPKQDKYKYIINLFLIF